MVFFVLAANQVAAIQRHKSGGMRMGRVWGKCGRVQAVNPFRLRGTGLLFILRHGGNGIDHWDNRTGWFLFGRITFGKGYSVHGLVRRSSTENLQRIQHLVEHDRLTLHYGDLTDGGGLTRLVGDLKPDEVYNLAAQSHVKVSFDIPDYTTDVTAVGAVRLLEAIRTAG